LADWLDIPPESEGDIVAAELADEVTSPQRALRKPVPSRLSDEGTALVIALRSLTGKQRVFLRALIDSAGVFAVAIRRCKDQLYDVSEHTARGWMRETKFLRALQLARKNAAANAGLDPDSVMLRVARVVDEAMVPREKHDREGNPVGDPEMDYNAALRGLELAAKVHGMTREADTARVTLEIVNIANREEIDARVVSEQ
jgi:hypothetical protein